MPLIFVEPKDLIADLTLAISIIIIILKALGCKDTRGLKAKRKKEKMLRVSNIIIIIIIIVIIFRVISHDQSLSVTCVYALHITIFVSAI